MAPRRGVTRLAAVLLTALLPPLLANADIARTVRAASSRSRSDRSLVVAPGARPAVLAAMTLGEEGVQRVAGDDAEAAGSAAVGRKDTDGSSEDASGTPLLVVTATGREAEETALALRSYLPADDVAVMPAWETLPHERLSPRADTVAQRLSVLRRLAHPEEGGAIRVLVVPVRAGALRGLLRSRTVQYLGLMSFSLYLVHEPVVVSLRLLTQPLSPWWLLILAPLVSAPLTWLFQRYIEAPSHRLARRTGALTSARFAQWSERRRSGRAAGQVGEA